MIDFSPSTRPSARTTEIRESGRRARPHPPSAPRLRSRRRHAEPAAFRAQRILRRHGLPCSQASLSRDRFRSTSPRAGERARRIRPRSISLVSTCWCERPRRDYARGGRLTVSEKVTLASRSRRHRRRRRGGGPLFRLRRHRYGTGIDENTPARAFRAVLFSSTTQGARTSPFLFLSIVLDGIVKSERRSLSVVSELGHGSPFSSYLPNAAGGALPRIA